MRHAFFQLSPPRHPLARAGLALLGLAILGLLSALGLAFALVVVALFTARALLRRLTRGTPAAAARPAGPRVIEGEYHVVRPADRQHLASR
jgi:hypothetical protein